MARTQYTADFEMFWKDFPWRWDRNENQRIKRKKKPAFLAWQKLDEETRIECMAKRRLIRASEGSSVRDCVTWINQDGWEDIDLPEDKWKPGLPESMTNGIGEIPPEKKPEPIWKQRKRLQSDN